MLFIISYSSLFQTLLNSIIISINIYNHNNNYFLFLQLIFSRIMIKKIISKE